MEELVNYVWCDCHGEIHEKSTNPYDGRPYELIDGRPVWYTYDENGKMVEMEPECGPNEWRAIRIGRKLG